MTSFPSNFDITEFTPNLIYSKIPTYQLKSSCSTISPTASLTSCLSSGLGPGRVMRCAPHATVTSLGRTPLEAENNQNIVK